MSPYFLRVVGNTAGYSYDTGHQTGFPSHRQLSKVALFILIYDKDLSSGCTLHAEKKLCISFSFTLCCSEDM